MYEPVWLLVGQVNRDDAPTRRRYELRLLSKIIPVLYWYNYNPQLGSEDAS